MDHSVINNSRMQAIVFGEIRQVAEQERRRLFGPLQEPEEIKLLREEARQVARKIIADALEQAKALREEAQQEGYGAGFAQGCEEGLNAGRHRAEMERLEFRAAIEALMARIETERQQLWRETEPQVVAFVMEIARKVVKDEIALNRDVVLSVIRSALRHVVDTRRLLIRVHADDLETVRASREEIAAMLDGIPGIEIIEDRRVGPGGCVVETDAGTVDARIETQFCEIEAALRETGEEAA